MILKAFLFTFFWFNYFYTLAFYYKHFAIAHSGNVFFAGGAFQALFGA